MTDTAGDIDAIRASRRQLPACIYGRECGENERVFTEAQMRDAYADIANLLVEISKLAADNANLRTVMVAAAEEIAAHWDAHCDAEGYGPVNLQHRLEQGIPSQYGYTAGSFASLKAENSRLLAALEAAQKDAERLEFLLMEVSGAEFRRIGVEYSGGCKRAAIDAAMKGDA